MLDNTQNRLLSNNWPCVRFTEPRVVEGRGPCLVTIEREAEKVQIRDQLSDTGTS